MEFSWARLAKYVRERERENKGKRFFKLRVSVIAVFIDLPLLRLCHEEGKMRVDFLHEMFVFVHVVMS